LSPSVDRSEGEDANQQQVVYVPLGEVNEKVRAACTYYGGSIISVSNPKKKKPLEEPATGADAKSKAKKPPAGTPAPTKANDPAKKK
jgi:hypothetical protein